MSSGDSTRQGSILVKFDEVTEMALSIHAIKMGKKTITRNGREKLLDHSKADAVAELVRKGLAAFNGKEEGLPLLNQVREA